MLFLCLRQITKANIELKRISSNLPLNTKKNIGEKIATTIEETDTYLKTAKIINQRENIKNEIFKSSAKNTPIAVATPFPPLNFRKTGQICPTTTKKPKIVFKQIGSR